MGTLSVLVARALRRPSVVFVATLLPCSYFAARGAGDLLSTRLQAPVAHASEVPRAEAAPDRHVRDRDAIVRRNVFDSSAARRAPAPVRVRDVGDVRGVAPAACGAPAEAAAPPCALRAKVLGAVEGGGPGWSFAMVRAGEGDAVPLRVGSALGGRAVLAVSSCHAAGAWVLLRDEGGARCYLAERMPAPEEGGGAEGRGVPTPEPAFEGIERSGERSWEVRRDALERVLADPTAALRTLRAMPVSEGGAARGVRLHGVAGTVLGRVGVQNGDVVRSVNGLELTSPDKMLEAYMRLRTADQLRVELTRGGAPVTLDVTIR